MGDVLERTAFNLKKLVLSLTRLRGSSINILNTITKRYIVHGKKANKAKTITPPIDCVIITECISTMQLNMEECLGAFASSAHREGIYIQE